MSIPCVQALDVTCATGIARFGDRWNLYRWSDISAVAKTLLFEVIIGGLLRTFRTWLPPLPLTSETEGVRVACGPGEGVQSTAQCLVPHTCASISTDGQTVYSNYRCIGFGSRGGPAAGPWSRPAAGGLFFEETKGGRVELDDLREGDASSGTSC